MAVAAQRSDSAAPSEQPLSSDEARSLRTKLARRRAASGCWAAPESSNFPEKIFYLYARIPERAFEGVTVNFVMKGKDDGSSVSVLHLDMASFPMDFKEAEPLQRR